jgi:hypothetical protein
LLILVSQNPPYNASLLVITPLNGCMNVTFAGTITTSNDISSSI